MDTAKIQDRIPFGDQYELDARNFLLRRAGRPVKLERIPMEILILLVERAGYLVTREEIAQRVWGRNVIVDTDNSINSAVRKIRQALRDDSEEPRYLQTIVGRGYLFDSSQLNPDRGAVSTKETHRSGENILPGCRIGDYRIVELIGAGGMGLVYRAEDLKLGRQVAIKFLPAELSHDATALERMQREARIASNLNHPNICPIYQLADFEDRPFIVMPLLVGTTLREWIELQPARSAETCVRPILDVALQIVAGLKAAHQKSIIHRDIKPANIFVTTDGEVKILDFGVAKLLHVTGHTAPAIDDKAEQNAHASVTLTLPSTGTPSYLSPEQIRGEPVDERSDIFSFGSVLYEMCTGHRAFHQSTVAATREAILNSEPRPACDLRPDLPARLGEIVRKAMERDRECRYQSAAEIEADLAGLAAGLSATTESASGQTTEASRKVPVRRNTAIGLSVAALALVVAAWVFSTRLPGPQPFRDFAVSEITNTGRAEQVAISPDGKYLLHVQDEDGLKSLRLRNIETGSDTEILTPESTRFRSLTFSPDGNYVYFRKLVNSTGSEWDVFRLPVLGGKPEALVHDVDSNLTFSPDSRRVSYVRANDPDEGKYRILIANLDGSDETVAAVQAMRGSGTDAYPPFDTWSPDGQQILYTFARMADEPGVLRVFNLPTRSLQTFQHLPDLFTSEVSYMPGGKWVLLIHSPRSGESDSAQISALSLVDRKLRPITRDANSYSSLSISADGKIAAAVQTRALQSSNLLDMDGSRSKLVAYPTQVSLGDIRSFDWEDDRHLLGTDGSKLTRIDGSSGKSTELYTERLGTIAALAHCPTGDIIINREFRTGDAMTEIWKLNADGSSPIRLGDTEYDSSPACSPDGKWVYYRQGTRQIKRVAIGRRPESIDAVIPHLDRILGTFAFSQDGSRMVVLIELVDTARDHAEARFAVFDLKRGAQSAPLLLVPDMPVNAGSLHNGGVRFSPDGESLVYATRKNGVWNLWAQPLNGSRGHPVTDFSSDTISLFRFSPNGERLAVSRVHRIADVVLLRDQNRR